MNEYPFALMKDNAIFKCGDMQLRAYEMSILMKIFCLKKHFTNQKFPQSNENALRPWCRIHCNPFREIQCILSFLSLMLTCGKGPTQKFYNTLRLTIAVNSQNRKTFSLFFILQFSRKNESRAHFGFALF